MSSLSIARLDEVRVLMERRLDFLLAFSMGTEGFGADFLTLFVFEVLVSSGSSSSGFAATCRFLFPAGVDVFVVRDVKPLAASTKSL